MKLTAKEWLSAIAQELATIEKAQVVANGFYTGEPKPEHLAKIQGYLGDRATNSADWFVCCVRASDNVVNRSRRKWSLNILTQMVERTNGCSFMLDHEWGEVEDSVGFVFDGYLDMEQSPQRQSPGVEEHNSEIIKAEGYWCYYAWVAIPVTNESAIAIQERRSHFISTGGLVNNLRLLCPICSKESGRDIGVYDMNDEGKYLCPHSLPGWGWWDDSEDMEMPYVIIDGNYDPIEISLVSSGNLPNAEVLLK